VFVAGAFVSTSLADFRTEGAETLGQFTVSGKGRCGEPAYLGTVHVQGDTSCHHGNIPFRQAGRGTVIAGCCTLITGFDTGSVFVMSHGMLLESGLEKDSGGDSMEQSIDDDSSAKGRVGPAPEEYWDGWRNKMNQGMINPH